MAQRPASQETCHQHELTGRGVPGGNANTGLVGRFASFLPSPVLEGDGKLEASKAIHCIIVCTLYRDPVTGVRPGAQLSADLRGRLSVDGDRALAFGYAIASLADGWCSSGQHPAGLAGETLARIPGSGNPAGSSR